jgi:hypothetical protein
MAKGGGAVVGPLARHERLGLTLEVWPDHLEIREWWQRTTVPLRAIREVRPGWLVGLTIRTDVATYRWVVLPGNAHRIADAVVAALASTR